MVLCTLHRSPCRTQHSDHFSSACHTASSCCTAETLVCIAQHNNTRCMYFCCACALKARFAATAPNPKLHRAQTSLFSHAQRAGNPTSQYDTAVPAPSGMHTQAARVPQHRHQQVAAEACDQQRHWPCMSAPLPDYERTLSCCTSGMCTGQNRLSMYSKAARVPQHRHQQVAVQSRN
jgi:hypothetical protein